ncbi:MAG: helix-turn-helix transcriptional regulator [Deltaproteobacteria bacterium]|nr:helix-turn-helix transcriptional regulator [Deltaproteobacteria bacterium]
MTTARPKFSQVFNGVVRRHRLSQGVSQEALSEKADIDRTYVGLLERGQRAAGLDVAKKLATALGLTLTAMIEETEREWEASAPVGPMAFA